MAQHTSLAAYESILPRLSTMRRAVYYELQNEPLTCDELEQYSGQRHQTISARVRELVQAGLVEDSGKRRETRSGRSAIVWRVV